MHGFWSSLRRCRVLNSRLLSTASPSDVPKVNIVRSDSVDPFFNLAAEEWMFDTMEPGTHTFFWWRNSPSVIIGRFQNPWKECHVQKLDHDQVNLVRRKSGGGAVYQDLGNSIFSFIGPKGSSSIEKNNTILLEGLKKFGLAAVPTGRNDLELEGKKISGSAFKNSADRSLHHGTLLLNVDLGALPRYLNPNKAKLESKGIKSVEARVLNLKQVVPHITHADLGTVLGEAFLAAHNSPKVPVKVINEDTLSSEPQVQRIYRELKDWDWRFGRTPEFTHNLETRFEWGIMDVFFNTKNGVITKTTLFSDCLFPHMIELLQQRLVNVKYDAAALNQTLLGVSEELKGTPCERMVIEFAQWLTTKL